MTSPAAGAAQPPPSLRATITSQAGAQAVAALVAMVQAFVLVPWYLHAFGPRLYGAWAASGEIFYWLQTFELGVPNILIQRIAACTAEGKPREAGRWFGSGVLAMAGLGLLLATVAWLLAAPAATWLGVPAPERQGFAAAFLLGGIATGLSIFSYVFIALARGQQRVRWLNRGQVAAALAGFAVTTAALASGAGLISISFGMLARALTMCAFGLLTFFHESPAALRRHAGPQPALLGELGRLAPSVGAGGAGYAAASQSDTVLAALLLGPESAALLAVNRRLFDAIRLVADSLPQASTGAFAYQASQAGPAAAWRLARQLTAVRTLTILPLATAALALNRWFVGVWTSPYWDGGALLTAGLAAGVFLGGHSYLANSLLRFTGRFRESAWLLAAEAAGRWAVLAGAAWLGGLSWMPWAGAAVAGIAAVVNRRRLCSALEERGKEPHRFPARWAAVPVGIALLASIWTPPWPALLLLTTFTAGAVGVTVLGSDPWLAPARSLLRDRVAGWRSGARRAGEVA